MKKSKILSVVLIVSVMISAMSVFSLGISADEYTDSPTPISLTSPYASSEIIVDGTAGDDEEYTDAIDLNLWISGVKPDYAQYNVDKDYCYRDYAAKPGYERFVVPTIRVANDNEYVYIYVEAYRFYDNLNKDTKSGELYIQLGFNGKNGTNNTSGEWVSLAIRTCEDTAKLSKDMIISAATVSDSTVSYTEYSDTDAMSNVDYSLKYTNGENAQQGGSVEAKFPIPESVKSQISTGNDVQIDLSVFLNNNKGENNYSSGRKTSGFGLYGGFAYDGTDVGAKLTLKGAPAPTYVGVQDRCYKKDTQTLVDIRFSAILKDAELLAGTAESSMFEAIGFDITYNSTVKTVNCYNLYKSILDDEIPVSPSAYGDGDFFFCYAIRELEVGKTYTFTVRAWTQMPDESKVYEADSHEITVAIANDGKVTYS